MAKAIKSLPSGLQVGHALLGRHGDARGSPVQQVLVVGSSQLGRSSCRTEDVFPINTATWEVTWVV
jgi:hypothetical protein